MLFSQTRSFKRNFSPWVEVKIHMQRLNYLYCTKVEIVVSVAKNRNVAVSVSLT